MPVKSALNGPALKRAIAQAEKTEAEVATACGCSVDAIKMWIAEVREPRLHILVRIAKYLNVDLYDLVRGITNPLKAA